MLIVELVENLVSFILYFDVDTCDLFSLLGVCNINKSVKNIVSIGRDKFPI